MPIISWLRSHKRISIGVGLACLVLISWPSLTAADKNVVADNIPKPPSKVETAFKEVDAATLSPARQRVVALMKQEYAKDPKYFDENVMVYTQGNRESWCADFISWVYRKAGTELINPHSGHWRIPGVLTLQKYFIDNGAYKAADSGYIPKPGDTVFYIGAQTPDNTSDEHAALVIKSDGKTMTTLGGNEGTGVMRVRTESIESHLSKGMVGYGQLDFE